MKTAFSILDLAAVPNGGSATDTFLASVETARRAEEFGFVRYWFAEHHNIPSIASSTPAVLIGHIAAHTERIRVGAGGVMLPNHSPLVIAEQFGTLATLFPGRIDLGLGRAPGGDQETFAALRRDPRSSDRFPEDVEELQILLGPPDPNRNVNAIPGTGTEVPLYILGSSLFGARLAAKMGLPYAFASHFAPDAMESALALYRHEFRPSKQLEEPYTIVGLNVIAAETDDQAQSLYLNTLHRMALNLLKRTGINSQDIDLDVLMSSPVGQQARHMLHYFAMGGPDRIGGQVEKFIDYTGADEVMVVTNVIDHQARLRSYEILAETGLL